MKVFTIGHSTHPIGEFTAILKAHGIERIADIRTVPRSRRNPQFNRDSLPEALAAEGIGYEHLPELGGLRHAHADSINTGWRNASFRGYADHMSGPEFQAGLERLIAIARESRTAAMCAEILPWRCHRSLVADALLVRGIAADHILTAVKTIPHTMTTFARVENGHVTYPLQDSGVEPPSGP